MPRQQSSTLSQTFARQNQFILPFTGKGWQFDPDERPDFFLDVRYILAITPIQSDGGDTVVGARLLLDRERICSDAFEDDESEQKNVLDVWETPLQIAAMMRLSFPPTREAEVPAHTTLASYDRLASAAGLPEFLCFNEWGTGLPFLVQKAMVSAVRYDCNSNDVYLTLDARHAGPDMELNTCEPVQNVLTKCGIHTSPFLQGVLDGSITAANVKAQAPGSSVKTWTQQVP